MPTNLPTSSRGAHSSAAPLADELLARVSAVGGRDLTGAPSLGATLSGCSVAGLLGAAFAGLSGAAWAGCCGSSDLVVLGSVRRDADAAGGVSGLVSTGLGAPFGSGRSSKNSHQALSTLLGSCW